MNVVIIEGKVEAVAGEEDGTTGVAKGKIATGWEESIAERR